MNFDIYCDESRQEYFATPSAGPQECFVLIGGLWVITEQREYLKAQIGDLRARHRVHGEFKWTRVSPSRLPFYLDLVNLFFVSDAIRFRCLVLPANQLDAIRFHHGDNELMFYKFYYQLLHNWILDFNTYRVFTDLRTNRVKQRLERLRQIAFFESAGRKARDKSIFSWSRAERIDWIRAAIEDPTAELYRGWDRDKKRIAHDRRITLVFGNYVVVLQVYSKGNKATFITAYVASSDTISKIRSGPRW